MSQSLSPIVIHIFDVVTTSSIHDYTAATATPDDGGLLVAEHVSVVSLVFFFGGVVFPDGFGGPLPVLQNVVGGEEEEQGPERLEETRTEEGILQAPELNLEVLWCEAALKCENRLTLKCRFKTAFGLTCCLLINPSSTRVALEMLLEIASVAFIAPDIPMSGVGAGLIQSAIGRTR